MESRGVLLILPQRNQETTCALRLIVALVLLHIRSPGILNLRLPQGNQGTFMYWYCQVFKKRYSIDSMISVYYLYVHEYIKGSNT